MRQNSKDVMTILFDDGARAILYSLVHRQNPDGLAREEDDVFEPTISAVFQLFSDLMTGSTPDLYHWEWEIISKALSKSPTQVCRLPSNINSARSRLVLSVEDVLSEGENVNSFELSKKLAGLSDSEVCAIYWHIQKYLVAKSRDETYEFPEIPFRG
ncbi:hypothetical protein [Halomonas elongata]|uniref:hypothetical protein n=1 Tax=Halomonas elongata TaxID=2746 RepID=UPI004033BE2A